MDYKRILTIQDISCLGQCSMTVALPVLSACGHETCILPTALLSTHTGGFGIPSVRQLADCMPGIREHWQKQQISFDAICTGYLGSVEAIRETEAILDSLLAPGGIFIADPAMADNGKLYSGLDAEYASAMQKLCERADVILPNITEAAMFAGLPFQDTPTEGYVQRLLEGLNCPRTVLTGVGFSPRETGVAVLENGVRRDYRHRKFPRSYHGTGDLFAACFAGAYLRGIGLGDSAVLAADVVCTSIENTARNPAHWYGVKFETAIPELLRRLRESTEGE